MRAIFLATTCAVALACSAPAEAASLRMRGVGGGSPPASPCAYYGSEYVNAYGVGDGCTNAPTGTADGVLRFQVSNFFTGYSGVSYPSRPAWNVSGVDYVLGINDTVTPKDPYVEYLAGRFPAGCTVNPTGNTIGGGLVSCSIVSADLSLNGWDFSGTYSGSGVCYVVAIGYSGTAGHTLNYTNNLHGRGTGCMGNSNSGFPIGLFPGAFTYLNIKYNVWNYSPVYTGTGFKPISMGPTNVNWSIQYNVFKNIPENPINGSAGNNLTSELSYNLVDDYTFSGSQNHGEITNINGVGTRLGYYFYYNTVKRGSNTTNGTANFWISDSNAATTSQFNDVKTLNNTIVTRPIGEVPGAVNIGTAGNYYGNRAVSAISDSNWIDNSGATYYELAQNTVCDTPVVFTNNRYLVDGSSAVKASALSHSPAVPLIVNGSVTSNVLTVLAITSSQRPLRDGYHITQGGVNNFTIVDQLTITEPGSQAFGRGTYTVTPTPDFATQNTDGTDGC